MQKFKIVENPSKEQIVEIESKVIETIWRQFVEQFNIAFDDTLGDLEFQGISINDRVCFHGYDLFTAFDAIWKKSKSFADFAKNFDEQRKSFKKSVEFFLDRLAIIHNYYNL